MNPERTIGETLRLAREDKGLSLEEVTESTRIALSVLRDLERDRFSELPGPIYVRNFLRSLSGFLELDYEALLERYREGVRGVSEEVPEQQIWREAPAEITRLRDWKGRTRYLWALLPIALIVLLFLWAPWQGDGQVEPKAELQEQSPPAGIPREEVEARIADRGAVLEEGPAPSVTDRNAKSEGAPVQGDLALHILAKSPSRVLVEVDGERSFYRAFDEAGGLWTLQGVEYFLLSVDGLDALEIRLGDSPLVMPQSPDNRLIEFRVDAARAGGVP
ncbi:MAG: helix-turn-helix domain-containing protein [Candidatus Krumholzibacteria bacterium]|nr:helix-turn-helix domain-containing protein [Candidatus Krumholzibacteria bacterium]MDP6796472.1 helix-turn-helix domain-containing protein [Candidatus Krumholzibacteria bacterium]MDP7021602.1 helix-turn-helix domain-containing protein [Candidatus Krumholzibacteria bacterium]